MSEKGRKMLKWGKGLAAVSVMVVLIASSGSAPVSAGVAAPSAPSAVPSALTGDFNGDGRTDIVLTGASGWTGISVALRNASSAGFTAGHTLSPAFAAWASLPGVKIVTGRFDSDLLDDIVLTGVPWWNTLMVARSNGNGTFTIRQVAAGSFPQWAAETGVRVSSGDFNADGRTDLALTGGAGWSSVPLALSNSDGTFQITNSAVPSFAQTARGQHTRIFTADVNGDQRTDLVALPGGDDLLTNLSLYVAFSSGTGSFTETVTSMPEFVGATSGKSVVAGDLSGDGKADLSVVLTDRILIAYSLGSAFTVYRAGATPAFYQRATRPGARVIGTDTNCDGGTDLVVLSEPGSSWTTMPVAMLSGEEEFTVMDDPVPGFPQSVASAGAQTFELDYDADGCEDLAVTGGAGWSTIPVAVSNGDGSYHAQNPSSPAFAGWAAGASPVTLPTPPAATVGAMALHDTTTWSGVMSSMAIGADGLGIISYYSNHTTLRNLRVAHCVDAACSAVTTTDIDTVGDVGRWSSLKIGSDGLPLISYVAERNQSETLVKDLKVAHCQNVACTTATITTLDTVATVESVTSLAIGGDGLGLIAYQDTISTSSARVRVAHCANIACTSVTRSIVDTINDSGGYGRVGVAVGNHGLGLLAYYDGGTNRILKVAACTNADCSTSTKSIVDSKLPGQSGSVGGYASIAFGHDGLALIAYNGGSGSDATLKIAHCKNIYCTAASTVVADNGSYAQNTSVTVGGDGLGLVSYQDTTNSDLKVAHCDNLACSSATNVVVDSFGEVGLQSSIIAGPGGLPMISYSGPGSLGAVLRIARCGSADCSAVIAAPW